MWTMVFTLGFFVLFAVAFVWVVWRRALQARDLAQRGVPVTGEVVSKYTDRMSKIRTRHLRYKFTAADGHEYSHRIMADVDDYHSLDEGDPVELVYLPDKPTVSAMKGMVDIVRKGLEDQEGRKDP